MRLKILSVLVLCLLMAPIISSCNYINFNTDELMNPPKPSGELYEIQQALESSSASSIQLKYPTSGDHRSAFTMVDLDGDSKDEAIAFYLTSPNTQNVAMHIGLIVQNQNKWLLASDIAMSASDVESLNFADMNHDGVKEIIVGWAMYTQVDRVVCAYDVTNGKLTSRLSEPYSEFTTCDLNGNGQEELLIIYQNLLDKTATAKLFEIADDSVVDLGTAQMDVNVTGYSDPVTITDKEGKQTVYLDATKADGMITEILTYKDALVNPCIGKKENTNAITFRHSSIAMNDMDGDLIPEIPSQTLLLAEDQRIGPEAVYLTNWISYEKKKFTTKLSAVMNYSDGYYLTIPKNWPGNVSVLRNTEQRSRSFMIYDHKNQVASSELLKLQVVAKADYEAQPANYGNVLLAERDGYVYVASISTTDTKFDITEAELRDSFFLF